MSFTKFPRFLFKTLYGALIIMFTVMGAAKATEQDVVRLKVLSLSQQAEEAAKRGDLEGVQEALSQVGSLDNLPSMKKLIVGYPDVQEILGRTMQVVAEVYLKEAEEAYKKGEEEKAKSVLKQVEQITQQLPTFIKGPIVFSEPVQERVNILKQDIAAIAEREALKKEEDVKSRLAELEEENRRAAEKRKAQSANARPVEQTDQNRSYQEGQGLASSFMVGQTPSNPEIVPGYAGTNLPQSQIKAHDLGEEALRVSQGSEASQLIAERFEKGEKFVIDPHTDPLIMVGNQVIGDSQKALDETIVEIEEGEGATEETKVCEESGDETLEEGEESRIVTVKEPTGLATHRVDIWANRIFFSGESCNVITGQGVNSPPYYYFTTSNPFPTHLVNRVDHVKMVSTTNTNQTISALWVSPDGTFSFSRWGSNTLSPFTVSSDIFYKPLPKEEDVSETIQNNCHHWEENVEKGLCSYEDMVVIEGPATRVINGYAVTRDWWRRKKIYRCYYPAKNDCAALRAKGCYQVNSACKETMKDVCVVWQQTYQCPSHRITEKSYRSSRKESPFCLSGDCADKSYNPNQDFAQVMSHMSVLKEAGADLRSFGAIFKGVDRKCTRHCVGFKDCCGNGKGWGVSLSLASCDADEKELAELRARNRCIQVGTYCAEKSLGVCIRKKTTFCCYDTKLAKIVQEQGKGQLGLGFGSPKHPQCQGLTPEQLSRIDFSRINFSDIFSEIVTSTKTPNPEAITKSIQQSMENKGSLLKPTVKEIDAKQSGDSISMTEGRLVVKELKEEPLITPSIKSIQSGNELSQENTPKLDNFQIQGRTHGQF